MSKNPNATKGIKSFFVHEMKNPIARAILLMSAALFVWYLYFNSLPIVETESVSINYVGTGGGSTQACKSNETYKCSLSNPKPKIVNNKGKKELVRVRERVCQCVVMKIKTPPKEQVVPVPNPPQTLPIDRE